MNRRWGAVALLLVLAACSGDAGDGRPVPGQGAGRCGADVEEPLDAGSTQHLLPGAPEPAYPSPAPTSGAHLSGPTPVGAQPSPLPRPVQIAVLEEGHVLVQHRDAPPDERRRLEALAGEGVVVSPNPALPAPIVATAWRHRLECKGLDRTALGAFIRRHSRSGPAG